MNEANRIDENKSIKPLYSSNTLMDQPAFNDFNCVSFNKLKTLLIFFLIFNSLGIIITLSYKNYDYVAIFLFISIIMLFGYIILLNKIKINYKRLTISEGKQIIYKTELFDNKIVSSVDGWKREYLYKQVTNLCETKNLLLLNLQYNLYLVINKNTINASISDVKKFLLTNCVNLRRKRIANCTTNKKITLLMLVVLFCISIIGFVLSYLLRR